MEGGSIKFHGGFSIRIERAINDISPLHQLFQMIGAHAKLLCRDIGNKLGARTIMRIMKFLARSYPGRTLKKMLLIFRSEKSALMMIKPPGQMRRTTVFEIDNGILIA